MRAYQQTCAQVIQRFEGHIAQYLGDGLLVYFGYPQAHEDDAQRAVQTGLGIVEAMGTLNTGLEQAQGLRLAVRVGIHTGLVVVGEIGGAGRQEQLALGRRPISARLRGWRNPIPSSSVTGPPTWWRAILPANPWERRNSKAWHSLQVYRVLHASAAQTRLDVAATGWLTPLVGRASEVALLQDAGLRSRTAWGTWSS